MEEALIKRIPPHSIEAEQSVIGAMLLDRDAILIASEILTSDDFYQNQYGIIFDAMVELCNEGKPVDLITLQNRLKEKDLPPDISSMEYVRELIEAVPTSANVKYYANIVSEKALLRRLIKATEDVANIFHFVTMQKEIYEQMLYSGPLQDDVPELTREEFEQYPMVLSLSGLFFESDIFYTYEQYLQHLSQTKDYAKGQENYSVTVTHQLPFRNIQIIILEGEWVMVSKNKFPAIHFVIHHPKMCHALENMIVPVMEEE